MSKKVTIPSKKEVVFKKTTIADIKKSIKDIDPQTIELLIEVITSIVKEEMGETMVTKEELAKTVEESSQFHKDADYKLSKKIDDIPKLVNNCIDKHNTFNSNHKEKVKELVSVVNRSSDNFSDSLHEITKTSVNKLSLAYPSLDLTRYKTFYH